MTNAVTDDGDEGGSRDRAVTTETGPVERGDSSDRLGRVLVIAVSLAFALAPLRSILEDVALVTGVALVPPGVAVGLLAAAVLLERTVDRPSESFFVFAVATLTCWYVFSRVVGLSDERLELATSVLLAETLVFLAAVATGIAVAFYSDR